MVLLGDSKALVLILLSKIKLSLEHSMRGDGLVPV